ncbi:MAG TPA: glycosyltransferase family A protein [Gemmatimonadaceae bacterium]
MKPISVVIPTARQPALLECALRSVARQTAADQIEEVLVSENLGDVRSREVCGRFAELPIRYVLQEPQLTAVQNYQFVMRESRAKLIGFLCDDDWWGPGHLQAGLLALATHDAAVASFGASFFVVSEVPSDGWMSRSAALWVAAGNPDLAELWELSPTHVLAATWILTPFHFSSMLVQRDAALRAMEVVKDTHPYQVDRMFIAELSAAGNVLYEPLADSFIRWRENNATLSTLRSERELQFRRCTEAVAEMARKRGVDVAAQWHGSLGDGNPEVFREVAASFRRAMDERTLARLGFSRFLLPKFPVRAMSRVARLSKAMMDRVTA